jgi:hypothetical protein
VRTGLYPVEASLSHFTPVCMVLSLPVSPSLSWPAAGQLLRLGGVPMQMHLKSSSTCHRSLPQAINALADRLAGEHRLPHLGRRMLLPAAPLAHGWRISIRAEVLDSRASKQRHIPHLLLLFRAPLYALPASCPVPIDFSRKRPTASLVPFIGMGVIDLIMKLSLSCDAKLGY